MWIAIDILGFVALAAYVVSVIFLETYHADILIFAGLMFVAAMIDRVRWSIDHIEITYEDDEKEE